MIKVKVRTISYDPITHSPILILQSLDEKLLLPLWIGPFEAYAILMIMEGIESPRPLTHRLLFNIIESSGFKLEKIVIDKAQEIEGGLAYFCNMIFKGKKKVTIDSRPTDAIVIALMADVPILVDDELMEKSGIQDSGISKDIIAEALKNLTPDDFDIESGKIH